MAHFTQSGMNEQYPAHWNPYIFEVQQGYFPWYNCAPEYYYNKGASRVWCPTAMCVYPPPDSGVEFNDKDHDLLSRVPVVEKVGHEPDVACSEKSNVLDALEQDTGLRTPEAKDNLTVVPMDISPRRSPSIKRNLVTTENSSEEKVCKKKPKLVCIPLDPLVGSDLCNQLTELRHMNGMHGGRRDSTNSLNYPRDPRKPPLVGTRLPRVLKTVRYNTERCASKSPVLSKLKQEYSSVLSESVSSSNLHSCIERCNQLASLPQNARTHPATTSHHCVESASVCSNPANNTSIRSDGGRTSDCVRGAYAPRSTKENFTGIFDVQRDLGGFTLQGPVNLSSHLENVNDALIACFDEMTPR